MEFHWLFLIDFHWFFVNGVPLCACSMDVHGCVDFENINVIQLSLFFNGVLLFNGIPLILFNGSALILWFWKYIYCVQLISFAQLNSIALFNGIQSICFNGFPLCLRKSEKQQLNYIYVFNWIPLFFCSSDCNWFVFCVNERPVIMFEIEKQSMKFHWLFSKKLYVFCCSMEAHCFNNNVISLFFNWIPLICSMEFHRKPGSLHTHSFYVGGQDQPPPKTKKKQFTFKFSTFQNFKV